MTGRAASKALQQLIDQSGLTHCGRAQDEAKDAQMTTARVNAEGCPSCIAIAGDIGDPKVTLLLS